jgi:glycosyltransferase involved in cell wall biosynthesis
MKIVHIIAGSLNGGAARGVINLHNRLLEDGIDSILVTNDENIVGLKGIYQIDKLNRLKIKFLNILDKFLIKILYRKNITLFSTGIFGLRLKNIKPIKDANIVHLHWINSSFISLQSILEINKPIVWTIRDLWPMTGGCHYPLNCEKYLTNCSKCPQLKSDFTKDLSSLVQRKKLKYLKGNLNFVGISKWVTDCANKSSILRNHSITTIYNGINLKEFNAINKSKARQSLLTTSRATCYTST